MAYGTTANFFVQKIPERAKGSTFRLTEARAKQLAAVDAWRVLA